MKTTILVFAAIVLCGAEPALAARGDGWIGAQFGASSPVGDFKKSTTSGMQWGLFGTYFESEQVGVGVDVAYHEWDGSEEARAALAWIGGPTTDVHLRALQTTAHAICDLRTSGTVRPWVEGGLGVYWMKTDLFLAGRSSSGSYTPRFGTFVGTGIDFHNPHESFALGLEGKYHIIQAGNDSAHLVTFGVHLMAGK